MILSLTWKIWTGCYVWIQLWQIQMQKVLDNGDSTLKSSLEQSLPWAAAPWYTCLLFALLLFSSSSWPDLAGGFDVRYFLLIRRKRKTIGTRDERQTAKNVYWMNIWDSIIWIVPPVYDDAFPVAFCSFSRVLPHVIASRCVIIWILQITLRRRFYQS